MIAGVFWQTKNMNDAELNLKYRENAGEDTIQVTEVCFEKTGGEDTMRIAVWNFWCEYFGKKEETDSIRCHESVFETPWSKAVNLLENSGRM